jgi:hypothetical protein
MTPVVRHWTDEAERGRAWLLRDMSSAKAAARREAAFSSARHQTDRRDRGQQGRS